MFFNYRYLVQFSSMTKESFPIENIYAQALLVCLPYLFCCFSLLTPMNESSRSGRQSCSMTLWYRLPAAGSLKSLFLSVCLCFQSSTTPWATTTTQSDRSFATSWKMKVRVCTTEWQTDKIRHFYFATFLDLIVNISVILSHLRKECFYYGNITAQQSFTVSPIQW